MKNLLILTLVCGLLAMSTVPALAVSGGSAETLYKPTVKGKQLYSLAGRITAVNASSVTVSVATGNRLAKPHIGYNVVIQVTAYTRLQLAGGTPITFSQLNVGQSVSSIGIHNNNYDSWVASRITVGAILANK